MAEDTAGEQPFSIRSVVLPEDGEIVYYSAASHDGTFIASVLGNGILRVIDAMTLNTVARVGPGAPFGDLPCTCVKWIPHKGDEEYSLVSVSSAAGVFEWKWDGKATIGRTHKVTEEKNEILALDIAVDGKTLLTAGSDRVVRLYDTESFECKHKLTYGVDKDGVTRHAHVNRIFSARFVTPTMVASAGWESPIQLWDLRTLRSERQILGAAANSDCIEPIPNTTCFLVAGGRSAEGKIRVFDGSTTAELEDRSQRLSKPFTLDDNVIQCRLDAPRGQLWCLVTSPPQVVLLSFSTGEVVGRAALPNIPVSLEMHTGLPSTVVVSCHESTILLVSHTQGEQKNSPGERGG